MKKTLFITAMLFSFLTYAQNMNYKNDWDKLTKLKSEGKTKDALDLVSKILEQARKDQNVAQQIKSNLFVYKYKMILEEDSEWKIIQDIDNEIQKADVAEKALLHSISAELLNQYYSGNSWKFADRTKTEQNQSEDFRNWDLQTLYEKIAYHYLASLENKNALQSIQLEDIKDIIITADKSKIFRPTLYDLVAHRAIDFFSNDFADLTQPQNAFIINNSDYFNDATSFVKQTIPSEDTLSNAYWAMKIFQDLLAFRLQQNNPEALADADIKRLNYVKEHYTDKDEANFLYYQALLNLNTQFTKSAYGDEIQYILAKLLNQNLDNKYLKTKIDNKDVLTTQNIMKICNDCIKNYPNSSGATNCLALIKTLQQKRINITTEEVLLPNQQSLAKVTYKNINKIYLKWIKVDYDKRDKLFELKNKETQDDIIKRLNDLKVTKSWSQNLSQKIDYTEHTSEIILPSAEQGFYVLMASTNSNFNLKNDKNAVVINQVFVSNIGYITKANSNENFEIYVLDRKTSKPLQNATVTLFKREYNYQSGKYIKIKVTKLSTDTNGYAQYKNTLKLAETYSSNYFLVEVNYKEDYLVGDETYYQSNYKTYEETPQKTVHFFTDRAIYRPSQIIYFKGILTEYYREENYILPNNSVTVVFRDANGQEVSKQELTTNEFGSFTGTFTAPSTGLLGHMSLETSYGSVGIQVEEYKRPKFEVLLDTIKTAYNLNDTIKITGKAQSYSGANVDGAKVKYTVTRVPNFPVWFGWRWFFPMPSTSEKIIATGTTATDEQGKYELNFEAIPDLSLDKKYKPYFNYKVNVEVTDINGETQTNQTEVRVGYLAIDASVDVPSYIDTKQENKISVNTNNLNGQPEPTDVKIEIYSLKQPKNPLKSKPWTTVDEQLISKTEFEKLFPYDVYNNENDTRHWEKGSLVKTYSFNTKDQKAILLKANEWNAGTYLVEFSCKDKNDNAITFSNTFTAGTYADKLPQPPTFLNLQTDKNSLQPGDTLNYKISSSLKNVYVVLEVKHQNKWIERKTILIENNTAFFKLPITEELRGGLQIRCYTLLENRAFSQYEFVAVPYPSKDLKMEWLTFRDKLLPGQKETWKLKISGSDKDKVAAELVTTLYDASLDAFVKHNFDFYLRGKTITNNLSAFQTSDGYGVSSSSVYTSKKWNEYGNSVYQGYDALNLFGLQIAYPRYYLYRKSGGGIMMNAKSAVMQESVTLEAPSLSPKEMDKNISGDIAIEENYKDKLETTETKTTAKVDVNPRTNLNETAFFIPQMQTDSNGNILLEFTMPEALTKWNLLGFAHTKDLYTTQFSESIITQKELMVVPNAPRFLREGDTLYFSSKITNLSEKDLNGNVSLIIKDALTERAINTEFSNKNHTQAFSVKQGQNTAVFWKIIVPQDYSAVTYEVLAKAGNFSDGEKNVLPVLSNRIMVTETLPLWISGKEKKKITFDKLLNNKSKTLEHHALTLEMSSNPAWYAVQALPYMMEYPYECAEQLFSRYYANSLASHIANSNPRIKSIFEQWKSTDSKALLSNLEKNQELKNVLLEESPWVREAQDETEQKKRIGLLFDLTKMAYEQQTALEKLTKLQSPNGGFMWFAGMPENRFITQYIIQGIGHLNQLNVIDISKDKNLSQVVEKAIAYLDAKMQEDFENTKKYDKDYLKNNHLGYDVIQYLYMRSFFKENKVDKRYSEAYNYYLDQAKKYWNENKNLQMKALLSMILYRNGETKLAKTIIESFRQNAINSDELGMYWKALDNPSWYWYEAPIETQALIIEAFNEITDDEKSIDAMKMWLLKQKQTTNWKSTKATAEACYALLLSGTDWVSSDKHVEVKIDNKVLDTKQLDIEAGTGYFKTKWFGEEIKPEMAKIELKKTDKGPAYGAMYWQYFEDLDKVTSAKTNLQLSKKYFIKETSNKGTVLKEITANTPIKVGDLITVRIELKTDRNLEYVHLKDLRAAGTEPTNVISRYKWQDGFGYYETTKDVATHFFIDWLAKGNYVFEYTLRASLAGNFSSGITQIECMYAPEFKAHSQGERQIIEE